MASIAQNRPASYYKGKRHDGVFSGVQTNIAPSKYLQAVLAAEGERFSKIIILCTKEVRNDKFDFLDGLTTIEYYIQQITEHAREIGVKLAEDVFSVIPYNTAETDDVEDILKPILEIIKSTDDEQNQIAERLYIDFTGGVRTAAMAMVFAARFLAASGVEIANIIYANIARGTGFDANHPAPIEECVKTYDTFEYFAGLVEQEAAGSTHRLLKFMKKNGKDEQIVLMEQITNALTGKNSGGDAEKFDYELKASMSPLEKRAFEKALLEVNADRWEQINNAVERKQASMALNLLNECIMELLEKCQVLKYVGGINKHNGLAELFTGYNWYYSKYLDFVKSLLRHLSSTKKNL